MDRIFAVDMPNGVTYIGKSKANTELKRGERNILTDYVLASTLDLIITKIKYSAAIRTR